MSPDLTVTDEAARERLSRAADYLAAIPGEDFTMAAFSLFGETPESLLASSRPGCGCLAGHIPSIDPEWTRATVEACDAERPEHPLMWTELAGAFAGRTPVRLHEEPLTAWLFSEEWAFVDDTPAGAAERLRIALDTGVPPAFARTASLSPERYAQENPKAPGTPSGAPPART